MFSTGPARSWKDWVSRSSLTIVTIVLAVLWAIPLLWLIVASLRPPDDPMGPGDVWFAFPLTLDNFAKAFELAPFGRYFVNTVVIIGMVLIVQLFTITLAAFAFANYDFPGKRFLFLFILLQLMIPTAVLLAPNFSTIRQLGLFDTRLAVAIPFFGSAFGMFLLRQSFMNVPRELVDAGVIDGCNWWQLLRNIYIPPSTATYVAFGLASVSFHWNAFLWPLIITNSEQSRPLTAGLARFTQLGEIGARWSLLAAATLIVAAPILIVFLIFQRRFIQSFMHSGIK